MQVQPHHIEQLIDALRANAKRKDCLHLPHWGESEWTTLLQNAEVIELGAHDLLLRRDDWGKDLYFLVQGEVDIALRKVDGMTMTAPIVCEPGSVVGEIAFLDRGSRTTSVWSRGTSVLLRLDESEFQRFRAAEPKLACDLLLAIAEIVAGRLRRSIGA